MTGSDIHDASRRRFDQAVAWHGRLYAPDADEAAWTEFTAWLEDDPANRLAFDRVEDTNGQIEAAARAEGAAVQLETPHPTRFSRAGRARFGASRAPMWGGGAALLAACLAVAILVWPQGPVPAEYVTRIGGTRTVMLPDGTRVEMNTNTKMSALVNHDTRQVILDHGEAIFHVAKDPRHPFVVAVGDRNVRVTGTVFDVLRDAGTITIFVAEGHVAVSPSVSSRESPAALSPGDKLIHSEATGTTTIANADAAQIMSWRQGYLVYRDAPLSKVVGDLNRYFAIPISLDEAAASQRFTGVLRLDNEDAVLQRISLLLPVVVEHPSGGRITLRATGGKP